MFEDLEAQALKIDGDFQTDLRKVMSDETLTPLGRAQRAADLDAQRRGRIAVLQQQARTRLDAARQQAERDAKAQRAADVARRRELLGDTILLHVYQRRVDAADADELRQLIDESADGYERTLLEELAKLSLGERLNAPNASRSDFQLFTDLRTDVRSDVADLREAERRVEQLDLSQYRASMADRLGVAAQFVPTPY